MKRKQCIRLVDSPTLLQAELLAKRDGKEQRKIDKTLKTIKSSRKFHSGEKHLDENMEDQQPDEDDYGYVSSVAEQLHKKLMQQYNDMPEDKKFTSGSMGKSRITSKDDILKLKDSLCSKEMETQFKPTQRKSHSKSSSDKASTSSGCLNSSFDNKKQTEKPKPKHRPAPIVDFQALLKLAEQKQHEEIEIEVPTTKKKEERPMTSKEKRELEEAEAARRARIQRVKMAKMSDKNNNNGAKIRIDKKPQIKTEDELKKPKLELEKMKPQAINTKSDKNANSFSKSNQSQIPSKLRESLTKPMKRPLEPSSSKSKLNSYPNVSVKSRENHKPQNGHGSNQQKPSPIPVKTKPSSSQITNNPKVPEKTRQFPPKDLQLKSRDFPPKDLMRAREFPPKDLMRSREFPPRDLKTMKRGKPSLNIKKREC